MTHKLNLKKNWRKKQILRRRKNPPSIIILKKIYRTKKTNSFEKNQAKLWQNLTTQTLTNSKTQILKNPKNWILKRYEKVIIINKIIKTQKLEFGPNPTES